MEQGLRYTPGFGRGWSEMGGGGCILQMRTCDDNFLLGRRQTHSHAPKSLTGPPLKVLLVSGDGVITQWVLCDYLIKSPPSPQRGAGRLTRPCPPLSPRRLISSSCWEGEQGPKPCFLCVTAGLQCRGLARGRGEVTLGLTRVEHRAGVPVGAAPFILL